MLLILWCHFPCVPASIFDVFKICLLHHIGIMSPTSPFSGTWSSFCQGGGDGGASKRRGELKFVFKEVSKLKKAAKNIFSRLATQS